MNNFDNIFKSLINEDTLQVNIGDGDLDPKVFEFHEDGRPPTLVPVIRAQIIQDVKSFKEAVPVVTYYIVGDILMPNYNDRTPIDVYVKIDMPDLEYMSGIFTFLKQINNRLASGTQHPIVYHVIEADYTFSEDKPSFNVASQRWVKYPGAYVKESIIDYAHKTLDTNLWNVKEKPPILRDDIKEKIIKYLKTELKEDFDRLTKEIHITGSIGTQQWKSDTDIDVHIVPEAIESNLVEYTNLQKKIKRAFDSLKLEIAGHPFEVYL